MSSPYRDPPPCKCKGTGWNKYWDHFSGETEVSICAECRANIENETATRIALGIRISGMPNAEHWASLIESCDWRNS